MLAVIVVCRCRLWVLGQYIARVIYRLEECVELASSLHTGCYNSKQGSKGERRYCKAERCALHRYNPSLRPRPLRRTGEQHHSYELLQGCDEAQATLWRRKDRAAV